MVLVEPVGPFALNVLRRDVGEPCGYRHLHRPRRDVLLRFQIQLDAFASHHVFDVSLNQTVNVVYPALIALLADLGGELDCVLTPLGSLASDGASQSVFGQGAHEGELNTPRVLFQKINHPRRDDVLLAVRRVRLAVDTESSSHVSESTLFGSVR